MSGVSSPYSAMETANGTSVAHAALEHERVRRDNARERYVQALEAYEAGCIARRRRRLVIESHKHTLRLLQRVVESVKSVEEATLKESLPVREATITAAELLLASSCYTRAEQGLLTLLVREKRQNEFLQAGVSAVPSPAPEAPPIAPAVSAQSQVEGPLESSPGQLMMLPILFLAAMRLDYGTLLRQQRLPLFSEVARAERVIYASRRGAREGRAPVAAPATTLQQYRTHVAEARALSASVWATQQSLQGRLYHLHQVLSRRTPVHADRGVYVDAGVAEEILTQLRRELSVGCVTLLRILCQNGGGAFDERGRLIVL
ncbi:hypothetical protein LSCM1_03406 [Leishmania martiniquensis]|uniref:Uncharacterized protein n=1 Tax=Leishmania martiniquensis TaxID=1580590 RepID=A0A836H552_9TRYP|nr:hypothetical protein LSCM1_03406 [Leishmania martiniquensis]